MSFFIIAAGLAVVPAALACLVKNRAGKVLLGVVSLLGMFVLAVLLGGFLLPNLIGAHGVWLPFVICGAAFTALTLLAWRPFKPRARYIAVCSVAAVPVILFAVFAGPEIYRRSVPQAPDEEINLYLYMPFIGDWRHGVNESRAKSLNGESALKLDEPLPRLDGATALYPVYSAFVRAVYPPGEYFPYGEDLSADKLMDGSVTVTDSGRASIVACSKTGGAFINLLNGGADVVFLMGVSDEQRSAAESQGLELTLTPIGREAFVFFVNRRNPIAELSSADVRRIYSGEAVNWRDVGGGSGAIRAYQRPDDSGSQTMLKQIMGGAHIVPAPQEDIFGSMMGLYRRVANYRNYKNSLGYSFLYYIRDMLNDNKVKFLSIDGIAPTRENIASGAYPFANDFYAVTARRGGEYLNPERTENIDKLLEWLVSPQGQYLVRETGYVPVK